MRHLKTPFLFLVSVLVALCPPGAFPAAPAAESAADLERRLAEREQTLGPDHPELIPTLNALATLLYGQGVDVLAGVVVDNAPQLILSVQGGACHQVFGHGVTRVNLPKDLLRHA